MRSLRASVIRLAYENPSLRPHLLPLVKEADATIEAGRTWGNPKPGATPDDSSPYNSHPERPDSIPAGANGSAARRKYNEWFQKKVCPTHATKCGDPGRFEKK